MKENSIMEALLTAGTPGSYYKKIASILNGTQAPKMASHCVRTVAIAISQRNNESDIIQLISIGQDKGIVHTRLVDQNNRIVADSMEGRPVMQGDVIVRDQMSVGDFAKQYLVQDS